MGQGIVEWLGCQLAEAFFEDFSLQNRGEHSRRFQIQAIVDCKSIYDHLQNLSKRHFPVFMGLSDGARHGYISQMP